MSETDVSGSDVSSNDVFESDVSNRIRVYLDGLNIDDIEVGELCDSDDSRRLDSAHKSDSDSQNWPEFNLENDMSNPRLKVGILFKSKDSLKETAKRAKPRVLELIEGAYKAQYENIYEYLLEVCKDSYRDGCRRIVGLDGCFLKGYNGGYLLATVGIDVNNDIYPIAYAAVKSENQASWLWFLELLTIDLEIELKDLLWNASRASTPRDFEDVIDELKKTNKNAYDWLKEKEPYSLMILEAKEKPILTMVEIVRTKIMLLIVKKKEEAKKWKGMLCPKIRKKLDVNIKDSLRCVSSHAGGNRYQVECGPNSQHVVNLVENSCSCRNWDLTSIHRMHALAVIHLKNEFPETYVQTWYTKQTQLDIYFNFIRPVSGPKQWVSLSNMLPILPPTLRRPPGRPTKVKRHKVGVHNQVVAPTQQQATPISKSIPQLSRRLP
ncbi:hypothetical protein Gotri_012251 [Gossypium trilobum]|uniref:SWIM-type domain-containing protein n=1 Tax=Gossypium trilobum TaxID=34281 RepID=A0A7J9DPN3_9ROSI|nr:hypothetical protein [Gossypium trilobum]